MKSTKYIEIPNIVQVIGCIYKNPKILENTERYKFNEQDFCDDFHKVVFGSMYNLWQLGAKEFTLPAIEDYLNQRPKALATYKAHKGPEFLLKAAEIANLNTFDYYYNRMKKMSLLRAYEDMGMDLTWLYNPDEVMDMKKKQQQEDWIDNSSLEDIYNKINDLVDSIKLQYVDNMTECGCQIGQGIDELIDSFAETPAVGYPLYDAYLTTTTRGARLGKFYLRSAATNVGKAIPDYTVIPTPTGFRKVGDIKVGDYLFGQDGKPTKVLATYPQEQEKEIWEVHFSDGRVAECCGEHLWEYRYKNCYYVENTETIYKKILSTKNASKEDEFFIRSNDWVQYETKEYDINPYLFGMIISQNERKYPEYAMWEEELFDNYPALWNCNPENKYIPQEYLLGDLKQRQLLLDGLLYVDGEYIDNITVNYTAYSNKLKDDFLLLCYSLGLSTECRSIKKNGIESFLISVHPHKDYLAITSIIKTTQKVKMTCFTVDNKDHLFLMNDFIVTHNTRVMIGDACYIGCSQMFSIEENKWIDTGAAQSCLFIATEQTIDEIQVSAIAFLSGVEEDHIVMSEYYVGEWDRIVKAKMLLKQSKIQFVCTPDFSMQDIENIIKKHIRENQVKFVFNLKIGQ
jgi:clostridium neurotoxin, translocation domain protein